MSRVYHRISPIKRGLEPAGVCPLCGRTLTALDRAVWVWEGWRRGEYAGCERCAPPAGGREYLWFEVWEAPALWF